MAHSTDSGESLTWVRVRDFASMPTNAASRAALLTEVPLDKIVAFLDDASRTDVVCKCLTKLLGGGEDEQGVAMLSSAQGVGLLRAGLAHNQKTVRTMTISMVRGACQHREGLMVMRQSGVLAGVGQAIADRELSVSNIASSALLEVAKQGSAGLAAVFDECGQTLETIMSDAQGSNAEAQLRGLELVARLWGLGEESAEKCRSTCAKGQLEALLTCDDILLQLNAVEILALLPAVDVQALMPRLLSTAEEVTGGVLPARLLECVARFVSEQRNGKPDSMEAGKESGSTNSIAARLCSQLRVRLQTARGDELVDAVNTLATLCSTRAGLRALAHSNDYADVIACLPPAVQSLQEPLRLASLCAVGNLLAAMALSQAGDVPDADDLGGCLGRAAASLSSFLFKLARSPVQSERLGALFVLRGLFSHVWGLQAALCVDGLLAHIMDRSVESSKRALEDKFEVAKAAASHARIRDMVGDEIAARLMTFVAQGPYGVGAAARVPEAIPIVATQKAA